jgi:threonine/homoserine/homoserine lactone efflux protein
MGRVIGEILPLAVAIVIAPVPVIASVLLLMSAGGRAKGLAFVLGWYAGLAVACAVVLALAGGADAARGGARATWVDVALLALGVLLLALALRQWRSRPRGDEEPPLPGWMGRIDGFSAGKAAAVGFAFTTVNPRNLVFVVAAGVEIAAAGLSTGEQAGVLLVFAALASIGVAAPLVVAVALGERSQAPLAALRVWMARNNAVIMAVLCVVIGAKLVGDGISGLSG